MAATDQQDLSPLTGSRGRQPRRASDDQCTTTRHPAPSLAAEMITLRRLGDFYEQHTFDTQGPYADLFAVLLSSCKHLIDISVELVGHVEALEAGNVRLRTTSDVLCGEVALQKAGLRDVRAALADIEAHRGSGGNTGDDVRAGEAPVQSPLEAPPAVSPPVHCHASGSNYCGKHSCPAGAAQHVTAKDAFLHLTPPVQDLPASRSLLQAPHSFLHSASVGASNSAWRAEVEVRLTDTQEHSTKALTGGAAAAARGQHKSNVARTLHDRAVQHAFVAPLEAWRDEVHDATDHRLQQLAQHVASAERNAHAEQQELRHSLLGAMQSWKRQVEQDTADRMDHITARLTAVELHVHAQQRRLRWLNEEEDATSHDAATTENATMPLEVPCAADLLNGDDPPRNVGGPPPATPSLAQPPAKLRRWLGEQQHAAQEEWLCVLQEVQDDLLCTNAAAQAPSPPPSASVVTATSRSAASPDGMRCGSSALPQAEQQVRQRLVSALSSLFRYHSAQAYERAVADAAECARRTDDVVHDVRSRLEVLEVYAPHYHAVASRPPLLGVELEDVTEPRLGVRLRTVYRGYLGDKAGLSVGDVIVGVGHQSVLTRAQLFVLMGELTRNYSAECRVMIEQGYLRQFALGEDGCGMQHRNTHRVKFGSGNGETKVDCGYGTACGDEGGWSGHASADLPPDQSLRRARSGAAAVGGGGSRPASETAASMRWTPGKLGAVPQPAAWPMFASSLPHPSRAAHSSVHHVQLAQCLPYFELCLHVVRDGRLRDVTLLVPPIDALRSGTADGS